jgi:hypothetical protein
MLLPDNIRPENTVYYNGAYVLKSLQKEVGIHMLDLYQIVKSDTGLSFPMFILCLDWLYLLNVATVNDKGEVICS